MSDIILSRSLDGGTISFEDGDKAANKADQYDVSRKVRVELNFSTFESGDPDGEAIVEYVGNLARAQVARLLGTTAPAAVATGEQPAPATRKRRTQAEIAADKAAAEAGTNAGSSSGASSGGESGGGATSADPSAIGDETAGPTEAASGGAAAGDPAGMDDWESPPAEVTDADLNAAVQKKNGTLNDPPKIRALIGGYNPDPTKSFQLREIPQAQRAEFLAKLEALK